MSFSKEAELKQIHKEMILLNLIDAPGAILVGLGLYGVFGADGDAFISLLNNKYVAYGAIGVGGVIMIWSATRLFPLLKKRAELMKREDA